MSVSVVALLAAGSGEPARAASPPVLSPGWLGAAAAARTGARSPAAAAQPGTAIPANSVLQVQQSVANLARAAQAVVQAQAVQVQAVQAVQARAAQAVLGRAATGVADGLTIGGLQVDPRVTAAGTPLWAGAGLPTQATASGRVAVTVVQTQSKAILNWKTFNVGARTALSFDQSAGGTGANGWVVLNRVNDPAAQPSRILGSITAQGEILLLNRNGILFGAGSQVNVNALIASTASLADAQFRSTGVFSAQTATGYTASLTGALGAIAVEAGARITTNAPQTAVDRGGFVWLLGSAVQNDGAITTNNGQTILAAGRDFILRPGASAVVNPIATTLGAEIAVTRGGAVANTGLIQASTGDITLAGQSVVQAGTIVATTSLAQRGTLHLLTDRTDVAGSVTLASGSHTLIVTDPAPATAIDAQRATFLTQSAVNNGLRAAPGAVLLNNQAPLADRQDQSRVEITSGGTVTFGANSLTLATGGQIAVSARARILAETGARLDVAGSPDTVLPAGANSLKVNLQGFELRDSAANRDSGALTSQTVNIDITQLTAVPPSAAYSQTRYYTAGGLVEIGGQLGNVGHTIREWTLPGGTINLAGAEVVAQPGAMFNLAGGSVRYTPGLAATSWLYDAAGRLYNIDTAPSNILYAGVYGGFDVHHARWGITDIFNSPLVAPAQVFRPGYSVGRDGGSLTLGAPSVVFEARIAAGVVEGERQGAARPALVADPYLLPQATVALRGGLVVANSSVAGGGVPYASEVRLTAAPAPLAASLDATAPLPAGRRNSIFLDAGQVSAAGLGGLAITTAGSIAIDAPVSLAAGAAVVLAAPSTHLSAALVARGGTVTIGNRSALAPAGGFLESPGRVDVVLSPTAAIDTRGVFTNRLLDPGNVAGQGFVNGGAVTIDSSQQVALAAGSVIDASSGGVVLSSQKNLGGQGGAISITAWDPADPNPVGPNPVGPNPVGPIRAQPFAIAGTLRSYGSATGGALSVNVPAVFIGDDPLLAPAGSLALAPAFFGAGFSSYRIDGYNGVAVAPASRIAVTQPVYQFGPTSLLAPSGSDPAAALDFVLPALYTPNPVTAVLTQRAGASLTLASVANGGSSAVSGGPVSLGEAASISVDPGARIGFEAFGQITVNGSLRAPGGAIALLNDRAQANALGQYLTFRPGLSIWLGPNARLDVSARAATAPDAYGRPYGVVPAGGSILLGSAGGTLQDYAISTDAFLVTRPGSQLDASGAGAVLDVYAGTTPLLNSLHREPARQAAASLPVQVASAGGSITLNTESGADLQGAMLAAAGGAGAEGGTLALTLLTPVYGSAGFLNYAVPDGLRLPRQIQIGQRVQVSALPADLKPADPASPFAFGQIRLAADQIGAGRFDSLSIVSGDQITFDGAVALQAGRAVRLTAGSIGATQAGAAARIGAPYVALTGLADIGGGAIYPQFSVLGRWAPSSQAPASSLTVAADTIDIAANIYGGIRNEIGLATLTPAGLAATQTVDQRGFAAISLASSGDIRFLPGPAGSGTSLTTPGNLALTAGQIYPVAGAAAQVTAGFDVALVAAGIANPYRPDGVITIARSPGAIPPAPLTAGGRLALKAGAIDQGGILRAPQGQIALGAIGGIGVVSLGDAAFTYAVKLRPGSVTSVSAAGLSIPYGGTSDGIAYTVGGTAATLATPTLALSAQTLQVDSGATLDLSGGGQLVGAAFVFGRGGSTDVLTSPLLRLTGANTVSAPTLATNPVFAILPAANPSVAPPASTAAAYAGSTPRIGDQITIGDGVPGLAAGTYTLLPGSDALLPGAFRVEMNTARAGLLTGPLALGNGSTLINGFRGVANTAFRDALPVALTVSPGAAVRRYAQYSEQSYSQFVTARAALFGAPRAGLPEDAKQLLIGFPAVLAGAGAGRTPPALSQNGTILLQPAHGGYGGTAVVGAATGLEITPDGAVPSGGYVSLRASDLNRLGASTLSVGGVAIPTLTPSKLQFQLDIGLGPSVRTTSVALRAGAVLAAPQVFLVGGSGGLTIEQGAGINTLGLGPPAFDSSNGFVYGNGNLALLAVSNGALAFLPPETTYNSGPVSIGACPLAACAGTTALYSDGTIGLLTNAGVTLDPSTRFATRVLNLGVASVNIGAASALAGIALPSGLTLDRDILARMLAGDPAVGAPALQRLTLTANQSINFYGSIDLNTIDRATGRSSLQLLQFNTPAIFGAGSAVDAVTVSTGTFVWNGLATTVPTPLGTSALVSAAPGGIVAGGAGTGAGRFSVQAERILLGYGPGDQADNNTRLDRLMLGFADVTLTGTSGIAATNRGSLSVYQTQTATYLPATGFVKTGGNLTLAAPALTGGAGSVNSITAGGALRIVAPAGVAPGATAQGALGAELILAAGTINTATTIALPSGRLTLDARGDITLAAGTRIDAGGRRFTLFDQTRATFGGDVALTSAAGSVIQQPGASIDISAAAADAGSLSITATGAGAGRVTLGGPISGSAGAGFTAGRFDVRAQSLDFDAINASLNAGGVAGARSFDIRTGSLVIGDGLAAHQVNVAVDGGSLTVTGTIAASGAQPGSIRLAARDGLTLAGSAVLDAHGTLLRVDGTGQPIAAANRGQVELTSSGVGSVLTLAPGAVIDLSTPDGVAYGHVVLNAARSGASDIGIAVPGAVAIRGAASIALNAFRAYTPSDASGTITQHDLSVTDPASFVPGSVNFDAIDAHSTAFILAAGANRGLAARLAGLGAYGATFHLRPGVEIDASAASGGNLTVSGDLDLARYRYPAHGAPAGLRREPGALLVRAANNLRVFGSITDGFGQPPDPGLANPDDLGWFLNLNGSGAEVTGSRIVLSSPATLLGSTNPAALVGFSVTSFVNSDVALNYDIHVYFDGNGFDAFGNPAAEGVGVRPNFALPAAMTLEINNDGTVPVVPGGTVLTAAVTLPSGLVYPAGTIVAAGGLTLAPGTVLAAGSRLPVQVTLAVGSLWPAGASLAGFTSSVLLSSSTAALPAGSLIPAGTGLALGGACPSPSYCMTRPSVGGRPQGAIYAIAPMLGALADGTLPQSWSLRLVGGADLAAADPRLVAAPAALPPASGSDPQPGSIVLSDLHYQVTPSGPTPPAWSVIRTGTGDLELLAGGSVQQNSMFGIYTAGNAAPAGASVNLPRGTQPGSSTILGSLGTPYEPLVSGANYQAYYPDRGGDVLVSARFSITGDLLVPTAPGTAAIDGVGSWLWRQGGAGQDTAWWINFGTYALPLDANGAQLGSTPLLTGFTGIGALGGGNVTLLAGGAIGAIPAQPGGGGYDLSQALDVAIGSTGRVIAAPAGRPPTILATGGGDLTIRAGGAINPSGPINAGVNRNPTGYASADTALGGTLTDLRGQIRVQAASIGQVLAQYGQTNPFDPRAVAPNLANAALSQGGLVVVPGDASVAIAARGDLVLGGVGDATRLAEQNLTPLGGQAGPGQSALQASGLTWFSLWQPGTSIALLSAGGHVTPSTQTLAAVGRIGGATTANSAASDNRFLYPPVLDVVAASGNVYYGAAYAGGLTTPSGLELAPAAAGQLQVLAAGSIFGNQYSAVAGNPQTISISGADPAATATPAAPAYGNVASPASSASAAPSSLFAFAADTASGTLHVGDLEPARFYAGSDIVDLRVGDIACQFADCTFASALRLVAAKSASIRAGQDIVGFGLAPGNLAPSQFILESTTGNLILNNNPNDVTVLTAGRDILYANLDIAGPGGLFVSAGRNLYQAGQGVLESSGTLNPNGQTRGGGAGITVLAGVGPTGPDFLGFANAYFNASNQRVASGAPGVIQTYADRLLTFLQTRYGYAGAAADALAYFQALPVEERAGPLLDVYFAELRASGREFTDPASPRYKSYVRGREAIASLLPNPASYQGDMTLFDASGIRTDFGGAINLLTPGGQTVLGVTSGPQPPSTAGVLTQGQGDIGIYSQGSVLLGQSRVFTTFGGSIVIWSATGDVNAGRGAKSTAVYTPSRIVYDAYGNVSLSPSVPTSGAGIATLSPIPGTSSGDVDLIAPLGAIDAGEAGIRVSGNVNLAALTVSNASNVQVQGKSTGLPSVVAPNVGALSAATAASAAATQSAQQSAQNNSPANRQTPSTITVEVTGYGS